MDKNTKLVLIIVGIIVLVGAGYWGYQRYQQRHLVQEYYRQMGLTPDAVKALMAGGGIGNMAGGLLGGGGNISQQIAAEIAKQEAKDALDEAAEAAKTPEDKFKAITEVEAYDDASKALVSETRGIVEGVFGKAKLSVVSAGFYGASGSGVASYSVSRLTESGDVGRLAQDLTGKGFTILTSSAGDGEGVVMAQKGNAQYAIGFSLGEQEVGITVMKGE